MISLLIGTAVCGALVFAIVFAAWEVECAQVRRTFQGSSAASPHLAFDETEICEFCGCGMLPTGGGWECAECRRKVEA